MKSVISLLLVLLPLLTVAIDMKPKGESMSDSATADQKLQEADSVFQARDYSKALESYTSVVESARKEFNRSVETEALAQCARMNLLLQNKETGRDLLSKASERADESDPMGWSRYLGVKGRFEWQDNDLTAARATFDRMYTYCTTNALWSRAVDAAHMIAIVADTPKQQIMWNYKGIEAAEKTDQEQWLGPLWNNLGTIYYDQGQYDSALTCFVKAREFHWRHSGEVAKLFADYHVGMTYRRMKQFDEAGKWLRPVLAWAERLGNHSAIGQACEDLGEAYVGLGKNADGLKLLKRARDEYKLEHWDEQLPDVYKALEKRIAELGG